MTSLRMAAGLALIALTLSLGACNSVESTLDPSAVDTSQSATSVAGAPSAGPMQPITTSARVEFAPIVGSTVTAITPLSHRLSVRARELGIKLNSGGDPTTTHLVKGYFSALPDEGQTTVIYVWDVLDSAGNRLHRIQGKAVSPKASADMPGAASDPWQTMEPAVMESIADTTVNELATWLAANAA